MIYVKKITPIVLILLSAGGIIPSSLKAAAHGYKSLTEAMRAGNREGIRNIVTNQQGGNLFKYDNLDMTAKDPNARGKAPLHKAAFFFGSNPNRPSNNNYLDGVRWLLEAINDPAKKRQTLNQKSIDGAAPLHIVAGYKKEGLQSGQPHQAQQRQQVPETLREPKERQLNSDAYRFTGKLIEQGADVNIRDNNGLTPLHWAAHHRNKRLVELLLNKGADANIKDNDGKLPLHWAAIAGYTPVIDSLLVHTNPSLINDKDHRGRTPLQWILRSREGAVAYAGGAKHMPKATALNNIKLLLARGADPHIKDNEGHDAFYWANPEEIALFRQCDHSAQQPQAQHIAAQQLQQRQQQIQSDEEYARQLAAQMGWQ